MVDGFKIPHLNISQLPLIKGEDKSVSIAAASIIAKVYRDNIMIQYDQEYPQYFFKKIRVMVQKNILMQYLSTARQIYIEKALKESLVVRVNELSIEQN